MVAANIDSQHFRSVLGHFCSGVTVVATRPPATRGLKHRPAFCINVLGSDQAGQSQVLSSKDPDKWPSVTWRQGVAGAVRIHGALAWIDCAPWAEYPAGDHTIVVAQVLDLNADLGRDPLLYFNRQYRRLHPEIKEAQ